MTTRATSTNALIYLRQSKAKHDSISLEIQEAEARAYCARQGYTVRCVVPEEGVSGFSDWRKRPRFGREVVEAEGVDVVVVYRWSRLSRRRLDQHQLIDLLEKSGKRVESAVEPVDTSTAGGRFSRDQMMSMAAFESDVKSEQWREALRRRAENGLPKNGMPRYGYVKAGKGFEPDPVTGPILAELYRRYTAGAGFQALVKDLNARGLKTTRGGSWTAQTLLRTLDSGFGAGLLIQDKRSGAPGYLPGAHQAVITAEEWAGYQRARGKRKVAAPARRTVRWHLAGIAVCGLCGKGLAVNKYDAPNSTVLCTGYVSGRTCEGVWLNRHYFEGRVGVWLGGMLEELASLGPAREAELVAAQAVLESAERALEDAQSALGRLAGALARGVLDEDAYAAAQVELVAERDAAARQVTRAREDVERLAPVGADALDRLGAQRDVTPGEWGRQLAGVFRRIEVHPDRLVMVPVVGEAHEEARPERQRGKGGRFAAKV